MSKSHHWYGKHYQENPLTTVTHVSWAYSKSYPDGVIIVRLVNSKGQQVNSFNYSAKNASTVKTAITRVRNLLAKNGVTKYTNEYMPSFLELLKKYSIKN